MSANSNTRVPTSSSEPTRQPEKLPAADSDGEAKIKADTEQHEKKEAKSPSPTRSRPGSSKSPKSPPKSPDGRLSRSPPRSRPESKDRKTPISRTGSSESSRPRSTMSSNDSGDKTRRRMKKLEVTGEGHEVTFTVTISVAVPTVEENLPTIEDEDQPDIADLLKKKKRVFEAPRAQNYYHLEYHLVPDVDELMKTDVVTYGMGAKVYMEKHDPVVKKTWHDGEVTWIAWTQKHTLFVTKDILMKLYNHTLELRVWDTKDKVGTRAKFDRPKLFKLPSLKSGEDAEDLGGVKAMVTTQCRRFTELQPKKGRKVTLWSPSRLHTVVDLYFDSFSLRKIYSGEDAEDLGGVKAMVTTQCRRFTELQPKKGREVRALPKEITFHKPDPAHKKRDGSPVGPAGDKPGSRTSVNKSVPQASSSPTPHTLMAVPNREDDFDGRSSFSRLGRLAGYEDSPVAGGGGGFDSRASRVSSKKSHTVSQASKMRVDQNSTPTSKGNKKGIKSAGSSVSSKMHQQQSHQGSYRRRNRKAEAAAQSAAEHIKKHGVCMVPIRMAVFFSGLESVTNRLETPVPGIEDMFVTVQLSGPLLDEQQKKELNPMIIKIHSATNMPETPLSLDQLKDKCQSPYCSYSFFKLPVHNTLKRAHTQNVYWDDINVILAGTFEQSEFRQYLNGPPLEIEVHDRDRKPEENKLRATLFGDDLEDEKISNVGIVASRRTLHNPFKDKARIWDPYGVARVDLSDLLLGHRYLYIKVPVHNCPPPDLLSLNASTNGGKMVGVAGAVDGPVDSPLPAGHYVSSHTMLKLKVELAHPLISPDKVALKEPIPATDECPFGRIVFIFDYKNTQLLAQLQTLVTNINARALELDDMPQHVIDAALSTYKLSALQQQSRKLNIITGFQVLDGTVHVFVLEGLKDKAVREVWDTLPQPEGSDVTVLYNSNLCFSQRLYGPLDVDLCRVKLHEPLAQIVQQPLLYVRDMVPKPCFEALVKLHELIKSKNVRGAIRNELFPTAEMVVSMSKEFGVPFTTEDFEELQAKEEKSFLAEATTGTQEQSFVRESSHYYEPIDNLNITYMEKMVDRQNEGQQRNFQDEYKTELAYASEMNRREKERTKPLTVKADVAVAHNYSTQTLNSTDLAKEKLRQMLEKDPDTRYTYCQDYLHSMTVVPVNVEALRKEAERESQARWKTEEGWIFPGMKTLIEDNEHPKKPDQARLDELHTRWHENILHVGLLQAPLDRDRFPWDLRDRDLELYRKPEPGFGQPDPLNVHIAGEALRLDRLAQQQRAYEEWRSKLVVSDTRQYFHRCLTETELKAKGRTASNQIARLQGLLKDKPTKMALKKPGMSLTNIPPLNVVLNPSVDRDARLEGRSTSSAVANEGVVSNKGFKPGPFEDHSWVLDKNKIEATDYEHDKYRKTRGQDFNVYHKERARMWRRPIIPLTDDERDNHLFRIPDDAKRYGLLPELSILKESIKERSATQPSMPTAEKNITSPVYSARPKTELVATMSLNDPSLRVTSETGGNVSQLDSTVTQSITPMKALQAVN